MTPTVYTRKPHKIIYYRSKWTQMFGRLKHLRLTLASDILMALISRTLTQGKQKSKNEQKIVLIKQSALR